MNDRHQENGNESVSATGEELGALLLPKQKRGSFVVTGCAGFIGSHLSEALLADGHTVVGVDSFTDYYDSSLKESNVAHLAGEPSFELLRADVATAELQGLFESASGVYHLAAQPGVRSSWGTSFDVYLSRNLLATQRVFEAAAAAGVRVVYASSSSVYGNADEYPTTEKTEPRPISPYGVTKLGCEQLARTYASEFGLDAVGLRYFTVYGPRQRPDMAFSRIVNALADGSSFTVFGSGGQSRDFTYISDAIAATKAAMDAETPSPVYNVGGGTEATLLEIISIMERLSGRQLDVLLDGKVAGDVRRTAADTALIQGELGWTPQVSLEEGLAAQLGGVGALAHG